MRTLLSLVVAVSLSAQTPYLVKDVAEGPASVDVGYLLVADDWVYFNLYGVPAPRFYSLWRSDGTSEGTMKLYGDDYVDTNVPWLALGRTLFFRMAHSTLLWRTDGTPQGTTPVPAVVDGFGPRWGFVLGDRMLISVSDRELWSASLTPGRPALPLGAPAGYGFTSLAGRAYYFTQGTFTRNLWSTDGTPEGTYFVKTLDEYHDTGPVAMGGHIYFTTLGGTKLWRSDGTFDGTFLVARLPAGASRILAAETKVFLTNQEGRLWVTDGTPAGTRELPAKPVDGRLTRLGDKVIFRSLGIGATDLWISDGTAEGTSRLREMHTFDTLVRAGTRVYFSGLDIDTGRELWSTDGSAAGTKLIGDMLPGFPSSDPGEFQPAGERLFFTAWTPATGRELWAVRLPPIPRINIKDVRTGEAATAAQFTVSLSSAATETVTVRFTTVDGTATGGSDYEPASGTVTFAPGETSGTIDVHVLPDDAAENNETFLVRLQNASGAEIETGTAAGIIEDEDRAADVGLALDFSNLVWGRGSVDITNAGPDVATNFRLQTTATPSSGESSPDGCARCSVTLEPAARKRELEFSDGFEQQYRTASVRARERDPSSSNNTLAWTVNDRIAMEALQLVPGSAAKVWVAWPWAGVANIASSDPSVLAVPATIDLPAGQPASFLAHALAPGTATIRVITSGTTTHTLVVDVVAPGTSRRWPGAFRASLDVSPREFQTPLEVDLRPGGSAPFTGASATGPVTLTANGVEVGRILLESHRSPIQIHLPDVGENLLTIRYDGDGNFLPHTETWKVGRTRGRATIHATAVRHGSRVIVRAHLTGSRTAGPGGTIRIGASEIPLTGIGPGIAHAEATLENVPESTTTATLLYSGDARYHSSQKDVPIQKARRRAID